MSLELFSQFRDDLEKISNDAIISDLEDGGFRVFIDGDNDLGILHTSQMLDSTRNTDGNVELRSNNFTSLTNLVVVRDEASIDSSSGSTNSTVTKDLGKLIKNY